MNMMASGARLILLATTCVLAAGCAPLSRTPPGARPADFAVTFFVERPGERHTLFVLEPDRSLRVAVGADVTPALYPPVTARLSPAEMDRLWSLVRDAPAATATPGATTHHVTIARHGRVDRLTSGPGPFDALLARLGTLAGL